MADDFNILDTPAASGYDLANLKVSGAKAQTFPRTAVVNNSAALLTGRLSAVGLYLPAATLITSITFVSRTTAASVPLNQWFALLDSSRNVLAVTADDTTTAWGSNAPKTLNLTTPFTTTYAGLHYLGINVTATTVPTLAGQTLGTAVLVGFVPILNGTSTVALTDPASLTSPATAITPTTELPYAYVS